MAKGDITLYQSGRGNNGGVPSRNYQVNASATLLNAGEPAAYALGQQYVAPLATSKPVVATDYLAGIAASTSTNTAAAAGTVEVYDDTPGQTYLIAPKTAASWDTQAEYNALVGARVTLDLTSGSYTINATDGATYGLIVENLNITNYPAKVAFSIRKGAFYYA